MSRFNSFKEAEEKKKKKKKKPSLIFKKQNPFKTFSPPFLSRGRCSEQPPPICRSLPEIYVISVIYLRAPLILGNSRQDQ